MTKSPLQIPQTLVRLCLKFYRPDSFWSPKTTNVLKIMTSAKMVLKASTTDPKDDLETLIAEVAGRIHKDLQRVLGGANGYAIGNREEQFESIRHFARYYVEALFVGKFNGDKALLSSERGIGLIEDTFEMLMRVALRDMGERAKLEKANDNEPAVATEETPDQIDRALWSVEQTDELEYLITNSVGLEIVIKDFDPTLAQASKLDLIGDLEAHSVKYPLEMPSEYAADCVWLEITTTTNWDKFASTLHIGSRVSMPIPFEFGKLLQSTLKSPAPVLV
jgi:hypothetical protein